MYKDFINEINIILNDIKIDDRVKPLIKLYFLGKSPNMNIDQLRPQIETLCSNISNVEFSSNNLVAGYVGKANVLTINKQLLLDGKCDEVILPVFMKFESALNKTNRNEFSNHIEDFIQAGRISKSLSIPISDRLYKLYEMAEYCYGDTEYKIDEFKRDGAWYAICSKFNDALNKAIITGKSNPKELLNGLNLFHYEIFTSECLQDPNFVGPYKNEEYQKKAARVINCIEDPNNELEKEGLIRNIKLFTGCTEEMIEQAKLSEYTGNEKIATSVGTTIQSISPQISEEYIVSKVQDVLDTKQDWDSRIKHLVIPFFLRSQKIYNWDIDEFQERLNELNLKIDKITFENLDNITTMGDTATDKIRLNSKVFFSRSGKPSWPVSKTLFHELAHVTDTNNREGIVLKQSLQESALDMGRFYEWTNTIFERLAAGQKFYKKNDAMLLSPSGYEALSPLGSMLACALGFSEVEFARIKDKGRGYEEILLKEMLPEDATELVEKAKNIFDEYEIDSDFSLSRKMSNQKCLNELYTTCIEIMKKRIDLDIQHNNIADSEEYKKQQMFLLKKMNTNYKSGSRSNGFIFSKVPMTHDIGFCTDEISKQDLLAISSRYIDMADYGFDNSTLGKYSKSMVESNKSQKSSLTHIIVPRAKLQSIKANKVEVSNNIEEQERDD